MSENNNSAGGQFPYGNVPSSRGEWVPVQGSQIPQQPEQSRPAQVPWPGAAPAPEGPDAPPVSAPAGPYPALPQTAQASPPLPPRPTRPAGRPASSGPGWVGVVAAMIIAVLLSVGGTVALLDASSSRPTTGSGSIPTPQSGTTEPVPSGNGAPDWETVAAAVRPATVSIQSDGAGEVGTGSGVIIDSQGHVITNHHVVANVLTEGELTVILSDGRVYGASVVGADKTTDLAVVKLEGNPTNLVSARLASSETLEVGQAVMAVGSPLGLSDTVTTGVISALDRPVVVSGEQLPREQEDGLLDQPLPGLEPETPELPEAIVTNAIQIDASINPGNSGGPLFDDTGSVIGINSSIASLATAADTAGSIGLGFAIPIDLVKIITGQIIETGAVEHSMLGVQIASGTTQVGEEIRLGAAVAEVVTGSAADTAGLAPGDVIVGIEGHQVVSGPSLTGFVRRFQVGQTVTLEVVRDGHVQQVQVTLQQKQ